MTRQQKVWAFILIALGAALALFFGLRALRSAMRMRGEGPFGKPPPEVQTDVSLIRDWMTVPYVARAYQVPPERLFEELGISEWENCKKSLKELNDEFYPQQEGAMLERAQAAVLSLQAQRETPDAP